MFQRVSLNFILCFAIPAVSVLASAAVLGTGSKKNLVFLGWVDGKSFFEDSDFYGNWTNAWQHCNSSNMTLATIRTSGQLNIVRNVQVAAAYWIAGRDAQTLQQFSWDDGSQIDGQIVSLGTPPDKLAYCLQYDKETREFNAKDCSTEARVVCELLDAHLNF